MESTCCFSGQPNRTKTSLGRNSVSEETRWGKVRGNPTFDLQIGETNTLDTILYSGGAYIQLGLHGTLQLYPKQIREHTLILRGGGLSLEREGHIDIFRATERVRVEMSGYWGGSH